MRLVLAMVLAGLVALPLSVSAQDADESATVEPSAEEPVSLPEPAQEEPALQLELDDAGVGVVPPPPRTPDGYTLEEMELRVKRARIGLLTSTGVVGAGLVLASVGLFGCGGGISYGTSRSPGCDAIAYTGAALIGAGIIAVIATGVLHANRSAERAKLQKAHYGTPRRVQWDRGRSRLVF